MTFNVDRKVNLQYNMLNITHISQSLKGRIRYPSWDKPVFELFRFHSNAFRV